eukprot:1393116-Alexandrium_andersonii.AAC.1
MRKALGEVCKEAGSAASGVARGCSPRHGPKPGLQHEAGAHFAVARVLAPRRLRRCPTTPTPSGPVLGCPRAGCAGAPGCAGTGCTRAGCAGARPR